MISNAAARHDGPRASRASIIVLHPPTPRPGLAQRAPALAPRRGFFADLQAVLRMAVGIDDEHEDYECSR